MNTANKLTMLRVAMIPFFLWLLYWGHPRGRYFALAVFVAASLTDFVDGYIARHYNQVTNFGKFMDPLADKVLVTAALVWFVQTGQMPAWAVLVVLAREFAVTALRLVAADEGKVIAAGWSGKVKTAATMVCVCLMLLPIPGLLNEVCMWVILVTTVYSGAEYFVRNGSVLRGAW